MRGLWQEFPIRISSDKKLCTLTGARSSKFQMKRSAVLLFAALAAVALLIGQRLRPDAGSHPPMEMISVFPAETQPGIYQQVDSRRLEALADQGWELVSVTPFVYRNEERNNGEMHGPRPVVTQTYPAYFFKRPRIR